MSQTKNIWLGVVLTLTLLLSIGCPSGAVLPPTSGDDAPQVGPVSFRDQIQPIFDAHCIICHVDGGVADLAGIALRLGAGLSFDMLVDQTSVRDTRLTFAVPGDSADSLLYLKVSSSNPPVGSRMPLGGPALSSTDVELIRTWIDEGAQNN